MALRYRRMSQYVVLGYLHWLSIGQREFPWLSAFVLSSLLVPSVTHCVIAQSGDNPWLCLAVAPKLYFDVALMSQKDYDEFQRG